MSIFDTLLNTIIPHSCLACGLEGQLLCSRCTAELPAVTPRCYRCLRPSKDFLICPACQSASRLHSVKVATAYTGSAKALIWQLKLSGARAAADIMAGRLSPLIADHRGHLVIVPVPTATSRQRRRGYDQAKLLARELARRTGLPYRDCLARSGQTHQHGLARHERLAQLQTAFRVRHSAGLRDAHIILVDDVVTTGATLEAAAAVLAAAGVRRTEAAVFAQP